MFLFLSQIKIPILKGIAIGIRIESDWTFVQMAVNDQKFVKDTTIIILFGAYLGIKLSMLFFKLISAPGPAEYGKCIDSKNEQMNKSF